MNLDTLKEESRIKFISDNHDLTEDEIETAIECVNKIIDRTATHILTQVNEVLKSDDICEEFDMEEGVCNACPACKINKKLSDLQSAINKLNN